MGLIYPTSTVKAADANFVFKKMRFVVSAICESIKSLI